jgi:hypothetical protein
MCKEKFGCIVYDETALNFYMYFKTGLRWRHDIQPSDTHNIDTQQTKKMEILSIMTLDAAILSKKTTE